MEFIEQLLGISPDGGSGDAEALCILLVTATLCIAYRRALGQLAASTTKVLPRALDRIGLGVRS